jgi:DNA-directed RNA polymerase sigma subunit (sigma70/sigma32)
MKTTERFRRETIISKIRAAWRSSELTGLDNLNPRERRVLEARLIADEPMTIEQLSAEFGVARVRVRQLEDRIIEKLSNNLSTR